MRKTDPKHSRPGWQRRAVRGAMGLFALTAVLFGGMDRGSAQRQFDGLCAIVKIEILQELALERIGFLATLKVTNNEVDASITDFSANLTFGSAPNFIDDPVVDTSDLFFVQRPSLSGVNAVDGTGIIRPGETAIVEWFIIPKIAAGGTTPEGIAYQVGASLSGRIYGEEIDQDTLLVLPDIITVLPEPQLNITYFQPRDVTGDDPFTPQVEAPIPFTLGVIVKNEGYGPARKLTIKSEQPRIVDNFQGLILVAQLLGARVDDEPLDRTSLTVNLGDIEPGRCRKGAWDMITSLSGEFVEFKASYTHASELGGEDTSVITNLDAFFIVHEVLNDQPGRDSQLDFLAMVNDNRELIPDTLYETDCNVLPVNRLEQVVLDSYNGVEAVLNVNADFENWTFIQIPDPAQAKFPIVSVTRSDGRVLNLNNAWTNVRFDPLTNERLSFLNIFDFVQLGAYTYTVTYEPNVVDTTPPVTTLEFVGEVTESGGAFFVTADTQLYFLSEDESPVSILYKFATDVDFSPAIPFRLDEPGTFEIEYFARDSFGNEEVHNFATVVLSDEFPQVASVISDTEEMFVSGQSVSVRPQEIFFDFDTTSEAGDLTATAEIFRGVFGFPTLDGLPATPVQSGDAQLTVGGENVDFYKFSVNGGPFTAELPIAAPLNLSGLNGAVELRVLGRSEFGTYPPDAEAVTASWRVDAGAPPLVVTGPASPTRSNRASFSASGAPLFCYRVDGDTYLPEPAGGAFDLRRLSEGDHMVEYTLRADASDPCPGNVPGDQVYNWNVNYDYGFELPPSNLVRSLDLGPVVGNTGNFLWDGTNDSGAVVPPGWYSVKITVQDDIGRSNSAIKLVRVGDLLADGSEIAPAGGGGQIQPHAFGDWAVWQDQRNGNWDIFGRRLDDGAAAPVPLALGPLNQQRPRTDGRYVVWEDRQADGTWDVWALELGSGNPAMPITATPAQDETRPYVDWPWIVFQRKPIADPAAPQQLVQHHIVTGVESVVDPTTQDQLDPVIHYNRLVWNDFRDAGPGEIYSKHLRTGEVQRITDNPGGQIQPAIYGHWIVWADNRVGSQLDLFGFNLKRGVEIQLTDTPFDESRPYIGGEWVAYTEDSPGGLNRNLRLLNLNNLASVQATNIESPKDRPAFGSTKLVWTDQGSGEDRVLFGTLPDLQPVFDNRNTVAVTAGMVNFLGDAFSLLELWNQEAGVAEITRYTSLLPTPVAETAVWNGVQATGSNFALQEGGFLWVKFDDTQILDLGQNACSGVALAAGVNAFSYTCFPDGYSAYDLIRELGVGAVNAVRALDSDTGQWTVASVADGRPVGEDFDIPTISVMMLDMAQTVPSFTPGAN